jgi:hypothetical protein
MRIGGAHPRWSLCAQVILAVALCSIAGCKRFQHADTQPLYQSGLWSDTIQQLRNLNVTDSEVAELLKVHQAGLADDGCIQLIQLARSRQKLFSDGDDIAGLIRVGISDADALELARLGQLGPWAIDAQGIMLAGYSDQVVISVARRRAAGQATISGSSLVELKNTGMSEKDVLALIGRGLTDEQAGELVAMHAQAEIPHGFVRRAPAKRRR